ncbi:MAG: hypothetical protein LDL56_03020 [Armatimonadetes bacterium]|nr:hypothetical protein [Armatimonadota bacterium]
MDPSEALAKLLEGNRRYLEGRLRPILHANPENKPYAAVLGCCDSRVPPELLFDAAPGDLLVLRTPAHIAEPTIVGALEHAVQADGVPLIAVLGHTGCRLLGAAVELHLKGLTEAQGPNVHAVLRLLQPSVLQAFGSHAIDPRKVPKLHLETTLRTLRKSFTLARALQSGRLQIVPLMCEVATGRVDPAWESLGAIAA